MPHADPLASFLVRVVHGPNELRITVQNLQTKKLFELSSWHDLVWVLQQPPLDAPAADTPADAPARKRR
ncbi:hypothetical protein [Truepera radiovictrix]|uniref:Uncharacterized protein n=1 Tax=Truepera radiovictrix (strain DSM 17093 / CIP 108686 / LMG 22925 / RQ-24) TaxID=649638 RepID=D7CSC2_TRURR|nr:hypothetical protein [Truepera radiovictrix]ADI13654.1 conserved hypothetical protein [Truepera radiovictrix DSM 17093]WMT57784.1 hypothetical protein RCV51_02270 [Truepera radiovictrix]